MAVRVIEYSGRFVVQFFLMVSRVLFYENVSGKGNRFFEIFRADDEDLSALVSRLHFS